MSHAVRDLRHVGWAPGVSEGHRACGALLRKGSGGERLNGFQPGGALTIGPEFRGCLDKQNPKPAIGRLEQFLALTKTRTGTGDAFGQLAQAERIVTEPTQL